MTDKNDETLVHPLMPLEALAGATREEDERHLIAREALIRLLVNDPVKWRLFCVAMGDFATDPDQALSAAMYYVENILQLDAPWLAWYLTTIFFNEDHLRAMSEEERRDAWISGWIEYEPPAPKLPSLPEGWADNLTAKEARARLQRLVEQIDAAHPPPKPRGTLRGDLRATTTDRVGWWYRQKYLGQSVRKIAKDSERGRADVREGIDQAQHWLFDAALMHFTQFRQGVEKTDS
jgi:hypothetical protein